MHSEIFVNHLNTWSIIQISSSSRNGSRNRHEIIGGIVVVSPQQPHGCVAPCGAGEGIRSRGYRSPCPTGGVVTWGKEDHDIQNSIGFSNPYPRSRSKHYNNF